MDHHQSSHNQWAERHREALTTHHSHEDVLNDREFERLLEACRDLPAPRGFEARFICLLGGRLDLRAGEIAHFQTAWVDWNRQIIRIPKTRALQLWVLPAAGPPGSRPHRGPHA